MTECFAAHQIGFATESLATTPIAHTGVNTPATTAQTTWLSE